MYLVLKFDHGAGTPTTSLQQREKQHDDDPDKGATILSIFTIVMFLIQNVIEES